MLAATARVLISAGGGWLAAARFGNSFGLFAALAVALVIFGALNAVAVASSAWLARPPRPKLAAQPG